MKKERDYSKGIIYAIKNDVNDKIYVGSTIQTKEDRFSNHKSSMKTVVKQKFPLYKAMREIGKEHFYIELIEEYPCENINQLEAREGYWQRELNAFNVGYNGKIEGRSDKEYYQDNKEKLQKYQKKYKEDNKEKMKKYQKKYKEDNKENMREYNKKYRENNKELISKQRKGSYEKRKNIINEKAKEKVECECGKIVCKGALSRHKKTQYHLSKVSSNKQ